MKCAFLGLGVMGYPMAGHLAGADHDVNVFNRTPAKAAAWSDEFKGTVCASIAAAVADAECVLACVGDDRDAVAVGEAAIKAMPAGSIYIDHTTTSASCAERLAGMAQDQEIGFIDAPVSGGEAGARNGVLSIMCGGAEKDLSMARPLLDAYARRIVYVGPVGHGQLCKSVNQIAIAGLLQGLSEAVHFATSAGLDADKVLAAVSGGAAQSWQMENRWQTMVDGEFDFGFAVEWMRKDLDIVFHEAERCAASLPITRIVDDFYAEIVENGGARWDTSSLVTRLQPAKRS